VTPETVSYRPLPFARLFHLRFCGAHINPKRCLDVRVRSLARVPREQQTGDMASVSQVE